MVELRITKSKIEGVIAIPPSKSQTLRAILFAAMADGKSTIRGSLHSADTKAMIGACRHLGAGIAAADSDGATLHVTGIAGRVNGAEDVLNAGNSGIVLRFCAALAALSPLPIVISGDYSIRHQRPMDPLLHGLQQWGASAISTRNDGYAPVIIRGPMRGGIARINGSDSQPVSAMLIGAAFAPAPSELFVDNAGERPWVAMTLDWFKKLSIPFRQKGYEHYSITGGASYGGFEYTVPGDFSSAAFPIAAAVITNGAATLTNVDMGDSQGDKELISVLKQMGANIDMCSATGSIHVRKRDNPLVGISVDINNFIDAIPVLSAVACYADGPTHIYNGAVARYKECDRLACTASELRKMGGTVHETADGLIIKGGGLAGGTAVDAHGDHRMAMALAVAALGAPRPTTVKGAACIKKTYPSFADDIRTLGAQLTACPAP